MKNYNLKLYRIYHNESLLEKYPLQDKEIYYDTSKNSYNKYLNEFCCILDDNLELDCEYIGFEHYRRIFTRNINEDLELIVNNIDDISCITYECAYSKDYYDPYLNYIGYNLFYEQLKKYFDTFNNKRYKELLDRRLLIRRSMFIMKTSKYIELRNFIKECLDYLYKANNINKPEDIDNLNIKNIWFGKYLFNKQRCFAYVGEFLINLWIIANLTNYYTLDSLYYLKNQENYEKEN